MMDSYSHCIYLVQGVSSGKFIFSLVYNTNILFNTETYYYSVADVYTPMRNECIPHPYTLTAHMQMTW